MKKDHVGPLGPVGSFGTLRHGYVFLITVLVIGAVAASTAISLILLGLAAEQTGLTVVQSAQAYELAQTCAERTIRSLRADPVYGGNETFTLTGGTCIVSPIDGSGNNSRVVCVEGQSGNAVRKFQISIRELYPAVRISSWQEVSMFTLCP